MVYGDEYIERMSSKEEIEDIQSYLRCQCFTKLIENTIKQHVEGFSEVIKYFDELIQRSS